MWTQQEWEQQRQDYLNQRHQNNLAQAMGDEDMARQLDQAGAGNTVYGESSGFGTANNWDEFQNQNQNIENAQQSQWNNGPRTKQIVGMGGSPPRRPLNILNKLEYGNMGFASTRGPGGGMRASFNPSELYTRTSGVNPGTYTGPNAVQGGPTPQQQQQQGAALGPKNAALAGYYMAAK